MTQDRTLAYYRNSLHRTIRRFREGTVDGEVLAKEVERFLHEEQERKFHR